jgi:predicted nucleic acid-binding Zn ribbon protein
MKRDARRKRALPVGQLVNELLGRRGVAANVREHRLVTAWKEIAGERLAARAWPDGLKNGVLHVRVLNNAWLHELSFLKEALVGKANEVCGAPPLVREVRLHLGAAQGIDSDDLVAALSRRQKKALPAPRPAVPSATLAKIDDDAAKVRDPELREIIRTARRKIGL